MAVCSRKSYFLFRFVLFSLLSVFAHSKSLDGVQDTSGISGL